MDKKCWIFTPILLFFFHTIEFVDDKSQREIRTGRIWRKKNDKIIIEEFFECERWDEKNILTIFYQIIECEFIAI